MRPVVADSFNVSIARYSRVRRTEKRRLSNTGSDRGFKESKTLEPRVLWLDKKAKQWTEKNDHDPEDTRRHIECKQSEMCVGRAERQDKQGEIE